MSELTRGIRGHKDDTWTRKDVLWWLIPENRFGQHYYHWWQVFPFGMDAPMDNSLRFLYFTVPAGAIINQAYLELSAREDDDHVDCHVKIMAELAGAPTQITSVDDFYDRPRTAASVLWHNVPAFVDNVLYRTPDLSTIIQELIDTFPDTRKTIQFFIENDGSARDSHRVYHHFGGWPAAKPKLFILFNVEPPPVAKNWLITSYAHAWHLTGKQIAVTTDTPCHLYLRFKDESPEWHARTTWQRGVPQTNDPGLAMKEYDQIEQEQDGDTLCHLFTLDPFPSKTRIWYYFIGTIAGGDVKSRSQFFRQDYELHALADLFDEPWGCEVTPQPVYGQLFYEEWTS